MQKRNYNLEMQQQIAKTQPGERLLLHSCCGPCSTAVIERLGSHFTQTVYFYNPNIQDLAEYKRRLEAQHLAIKQVTTRYPVTLITAPYDPTPFNKVAEAHKQAPEGGARCTACYKLRLEKTAELARTEGFPTFTTTLTVSPRKDQVRLNEIGQTLEMVYNITHLPADFKKQGGYQRSIELANTWNLYRQSYCGCLFSIR